MKALEEINKIKDRVLEIERLINTGRFIQECLVGIEDGDVRKCIIRYVDALQGLQFEKEQLEANIEAAKAQVKRDLIDADITKVKVGSVNARISKRTTYGGLDSEIALRDKGLLESAIESGALTYPPTIKSAKLTAEMKEAIDGAKKVTHSITIK